MEQPGKYYAKEGLWQILPHLTVSFIAADLIFICTDAVQHDWEFASFVIDVKISNIAQNNLGAGRVAIHGGSSLIAAAHNRLIVFAIWHWCVRPSITQYFGTSRPTTSNGIWVASAVFSQCTFITNEQRRQNSTGYIWAAYAVPCRVIDATLY